MEEPNELLMEGDDDLLDYFLGEGPDGFAGFDLGGSNLDMNMNMDEVNDGMASLLTKHDPMKDGDTVVSSVMNDDAMFGDNFGLLEPVSTSPPSMAQWESTAALKADTSGPARGRGRGSSTRSTTKAKPRAKAKTTKSQMNAATSVAKDPVKKETHAMKMDIQGSGQEKAGPSETEEKRLRRLARNRESARQSRRRKKEHLELLEDRVAKLTKELDDLRRQHLEKVNRVSRANKLKHLQELAKLCKQPNSEAQVKSGIENVLKLYGPNSHDQKKFMEYHYKHIFALLLPTYTKYFVWMLNEGEGFFEPPLNAQGGSGKPSVWQSFCNEIHLTQDQQEKLKSDFKQQHSDSALEERMKLNTCINYLQQMRSRFNLRSKVIETQSRAIFDILTPEQTVNYLLWAETNRERIEESGANDLLLAGVDDSSANGVIDARLNAARLVLEKPEAAMTMDDLKVLMAALDG